MKTRPAETQTSTTTGRPEYGHFEHDHDHSDHDHPEHGHHEHVHFEHGHHDGAEHGDPEFAGPEYGTDGSGGPSRGGGRRRSRRGRFAGRREFAQWREFAGLGLPPVRFGRREFVEFDPEDGEGAGPGGFGPGRFGPRGFGPGGFGPGGFGPGGFGPGGRGGRGPGGHGPWSGRGRRPRGNVRAAVLALLAEEPRHGYAIMTELTERSGGLWRPSPGSVYPVLQQLQDEGLISSEESEGRKVFSLTVAGRELVEANPAEFAEPWSVAGPGPRQRVKTLFEGMAALGLATQQVARLGTDEQAERARAVLDEARRALYRILAEEEPGDVTQETSSGE